MKIDFPLYDRNADELRENDIREKPILEFSDNQGAGYYFHSSLMALKTPDGEAVFVKDTDLITLGRALEGRKIGNGN